MKTIIASEFQKEHILRNIAEKNNGIAQDVQVLTISTALKEEKDDDILLSLRFKDSLKKQIDSFPIYGKMFSYPSFLSEILSFAKECILYGITEDQLPETNNNEAELKQIVATALKLDLKEKQNVLKKDLDRSDVLLHYQFIQDVYHYDLFESLKSKYPYEAYPSNDPHVSLRYTLSSREEAEAIAQDISRNGIPANIILTSISQLPLYESVLTRYDIPFTSLKEDKPLRIPLIFQALIELGIYKDRTSFLNALKCNAFSRKADASTYAFFHESCTSVSFPQEIEQGGSDLFEKEVRDYRCAYEKAKEYYDSIKEELDSLIECEKEDLINNAFEILRRSDLLKDKVEMQAASSIRNTLIEAKDMLKTVEDLLFLTRCFENIHASKQVSNSDFVVISDLTHPVAPRKKSYVVSCCGTNYPGVPVKGGLFDEAYVEKIRNYPHQEERYAMYMEQLKWVENSASEELIYSHYTNDYQGREIQFAFEIESRYEEEKKWDLVSLSPYKQPAHVLKRESARQLFEKNGKLNGSISTIERYFACPYSYFIRSGLKVRKKDVPSLDAASIGSIQHKILQDSVERNGKDYASLSREEVESFLDPAFALLEQLHPCEVSFVRLSKQRLIDSMMTSLSFLADMEANTSFSPAQCEYVFSEDITDSVHLFGIIDRLDLYRNEMLRIIDYKSSSHSLSETKVKAGAQLQLLTYLIIAQRKWDLPVAGAYYFSFKEESYQQEAKKVSYNKVSETDWSKECETKRMFDTRRLSGWRFTDRTTELDASDTHIRNKKDQYDYALVEQCILSLYDLFHVALLNGDISLDPREDACTFCDYKSICRFHGEKRKTEAQVMADISLKRKEE